MKKLIIKMIIAAYAFLILGGATTVLNAMYNGNGPQF